MNHCNNYVYHLFGTYIYCINFRRVAILSPLDKKKLNHLALYKVKTITNFQVCQNLPSDFSYWGMACHCWQQQQIFTQILAGDIWNAANVPSPSLPTFLLRWLEPSLQGTLLLKGFKLNAFIMQIDWLTRWNEWQWALPLTSKIVWR
jgi:hypothetical protein